ncbi:MAG: mono/diheme cytochrome c family protein [Zhongshania sp.]|jgi:mono/diheme cytochrome c family protein
MMRNALDTLGCQCNRASGTKRLFEIIQSTGNYAMMKYLSATLLIVVSAFYLLIWQAPTVHAKPIDQSAFSTAAVEKGRVLAGLGNCASCHTVDKAKPFAGGVSFSTPFGTLYSTNITPDPGVGIGQWSLPAFSRAMREGVSRDGSHLFPAFPYTHFKHLSDEDISSLYAYVMTRKPIAEQPPKNQLQFPFNLRFLQAGWKLLFFDKDQCWQPDPKQSEVFNRGAYLAQGLGHCSSCHTPRNSFGAEISDQKYDGALVNNWYAPALNSRQSVPIHWNEPLLYDYLRAGQSDIQGVAIGSMAEVVHQGLALAPNSDIRALSVYINSLSGNHGGEDSRSNTAAAKQLISAANQYVAEEASPEDKRGEQLYRGACVACHYNSADKPKAVRAELSLNSTVTADDPTNLLRIMLEGITADNGTPGIVMPGFSSLNDSDLIALAQFLRVRAKQPHWNNLQQRLDELRR